MIHGFDGHEAVEIDGLKREDSALAPEGSDHLKSCCDFGFGERRVGGDVALEEGAEVLFRFAVDDDRLGTHTVLDLGGSGGFAFGEASGGFGARWSHTHATRPGVPRHARRKF